MIFIIGFYFYYLWNSQIIYLRDSVSFRSNYLLFTFIVILLLYIFNFYVLYIDLVISILSFFWYLKLKLETVLYDYIKPRIFTNLFLFISLFLFYYSFYYLLII